MYKLSLLSPFEWQSLSACCLIDNLSKQTADMQVKACLLMTKGTPLTYNESAVFRKQIFVDNKWAYHCMSAVCLP